MKAAIRVAVVGLLATAVAVLLTYAPNPFPRWSPVLPVGVTLAVLLGIGIAREFPDD